MNLREVLRQILKINAESGEHQGITEDSAAQFTHFPVPAAVQALW